MMKKPGLNMALLALLCFPMGCRDRAAKTPGPSLQADIAAIKALEAEWVRLYNAGDFDRLMSVFYADDIMLMAPNSPSRRGKNDVLLSYRKDDEANVERVETSLVEDVRVSGDLAVARGRDTGMTTSRKEATTVPYDLKWVMVFERQPDGTWKCVYEIWNESPLPRMSTGDQPS
jgi:ketosteroid isomerase-like protein